MEFINEYLIIIDKKVNSGFYSLCNNVNRFKEIIHGSDGIKIEKNKIVKDQYKCNFNITRGEVKGKEQRFFLCRIEEDSKSNLELYKDLLKSFKRILYAQEVYIETLRDDLSCYYSEIAYSEIHKIENLMRKFITYFMVTAVGKDWAKMSSPKNIKDKIENTNKNEYIDVLQELDFIQLGDFLFSLYQDDSIENLINKLKAYENQTINQIEFNELKNFVPKSNWDKYFKEKILCEDTYLNKRWKALYELRNKVAHNKTFLEKDLNEVVKLTDDIKTILEKAFDSIDYIELSELEKDQLSENIVSSTNNLTKDYLKNWKEIEKYLSDMKEIDHQNFEGYLLSLKNEEYIDEEEYNKIQKMYLIRNELVHNISVDEYNYKHLNQDMKTLKRDLSLSWKNELINALNALGGKATLDQIYTYIEKHTTRNLPRTWNSTVRRTIYNYSSDADIYLGKEDLFEKVGKGTWKLKKEAK